MPHQMNFLDPVFHPKVTCNKSSTANYEVENLISNNFIEKSRGFMAYTIVKPPVEIVFEFICPINIDYISINSTVGSHKSSGIEIFAENAKKYLPVGKSVYDNDGVVFCSSSKYSMEKLPPNISTTNYHVCFLKRCFVLTNSKSVKIIIFKTGYFGHFVPCLGSVQIWGTVANECSDVTRNTIHRLAEKSQGYNSNLYSSLTASTNCDSSTNSQQTKESLQIPEDFKDDLTFEIMTLPMTLPSGKTIDQSTLDKHIESERTLGRKPSDPFTGLKFTKTTKPVLNVALKSRIDMYLLQHAPNPDYFKLDRSVGRRNPSSSAVENDSLVKINRIKIDLYDDEIIFDVSKLNFKQFAEKTVPCCSICKTEEMLYSLPCKHLYCRKCVTDICRDLKCTKCLNIFEKASIEKFNV